MPVLEHWGNFYEIIGESAGALTGLQFVVMTLVAQQEAAGSMREIRAFGTPTVVHFCFALMISAVLSAPWSTLSQVGTCLAVCGAGGLAYALTVIRHARKQNGYAADAGDWFWYVVLPLVTYATLIPEGIYIARGVVWYLFLTAVTALAFLLIGIHNSWDTVTYVAVQRRQQRGNSQSGSPEKPKPRED